MPYKSRIPQIAAQASLQTQRVVHETAQEVEFKVSQRLAERKRTGEEASNVWVYARGGRPFYAEVRAGFVTRFHEYGTLHMAARPVLGPVAEEVRNSFVADAAAAWRV